MENRKRYTAIVLAAGSGRRMQSDTPKQFMELCGHPLVYYSLYAFEKSPVDDIILVTGKDDVSYCRKEIVEACDFRKVRAVIPGGKERYLSVYEGLKAAAGTDSNPDCCGRFTSSRIRSGSICRMSSTT